MSKSLKSVTERQLKLIQIGAWFCPLACPLMLIKLALTMLYLLAIELAKMYFYSRTENAIA